MPIRHPDAAHAQPIPQRPRGITAIALLQWGVAGMLALLGLLFVLQGLFPPKTTVAHATGVWSLASVLLSSTWMLVYVGKGLWRMERGSYLVAVFVYLLATLAQLIAVTQGYYWLILPAVLTASIFVYLFRSRTYWIFYAKPDA